MIAVQEAFSKIAQRPNDCVIIKMAKKKESKLIKCENWCLREEGEKLF